MMVILILFHAIRMVPYLRDGTGNFHKQSFNLPPIGPFRFLRTFLKDIDGDVDDDFGYSITTVCLMFTNG